MQFHLRNKINLIQKCLLTAVIVACLERNLAHAHHREELFKLIGSDTTTDNVFGHSVAISGNIAIVGAPQFSNSVEWDGAAYVFDLTTRQELFKLTASDAARYLNFGVSVAVNENLAVVGATGPARHPGSAYVFDLSSGRELFKLTAGDAVNDNYFGNSISISGTIAVVGAPEDNHAGSRSGSAYLFDLTSGRQLFKLTAADIAAGDRFGSSVGISGRTAIIASRGDDDHGDTSGAAYLFDVDSGEQVTKLTPSDASSQGEFGQSVAISGNTAIVGATPVGRSGAAYVFDVATGREISKLTPSSTEADHYFGYATAISGNTAIITSPYLTPDDPTGGTNSAYLFDVTTGRQLARLIASDNLNSYVVATSVGIIETVVIVGAPWDDDRGIESGSAYIFSVVPEPEILALLGTSAAVAWLRRRRYYKLASNYSPFDPPR